MGHRKEYSVRDARIPILTERIRKTIDNYGTISEFADKIGYSVTTVNHWYNGGRTPDADGLRAFSMVTGISADYLLGLSDTQTTERDKRIACEYSGLSDDAMTALHEASGSESLDGKTNMAIVNAILASNEFWGSVIPNLNRAVFYERATDDAFDCGLTDEQKQIQKLGGYGIVISREKAVEYYTYEAVRALDEKLHGIVKNASEVI